MDTYLNQIKKLQEKKHAFENEVNSALMLNSFQIMDIRNNLTKISKPYWFWHISIFIMVIVLLIPAAEALFFAQAVLLLQIGGILMHLSETSKMRIELKKLKRKKRFIKQHENYQIKTINEKIKEIEMKSTNEKETPVLKAPVQKKENAIERVETNKLNAFSYACGLVLKQTNPIQEHLIYEKQKILVKRN